MQKISIGKILKPQGIKGELKLLPFTDVPAVFDKIKNVEIDGKEYIVKHCNYRMNFVYLLLEEITDRNQAELFRNKKVFIDKNLLEESKEEDTYLVEELEGCVVYDENDNEIGVIKSVENYGATDIINIFCKDRIYMTPFLQEVFTFVNTESKIVKINKEKFEEVRVCE